jgi:membrane dipeptidase
MNAAKLHKESILFDAHCDTLLAVKAGRKLGVRGTEGHIDIPRLTEGGVTAQIFAIFVQEELRPVAPYRGLQLLDAFYQVLTENPGKLVHATRASDIEDAKTKGVPAAVLGFEGCEALAGDLGLLRMFYRLGVRNVGLTWNWRNQAADGVGEKRTGGGLTNFGVDLVKEMNRLGIMIDVAHLSPQGIKDVLEISEAPIIDSHCASTALCDHQRNLTDEQLEAVAKNGGVACLTYVPPFLTPDQNEVPLSRVLEHMDHMVKVAGEDHVGLGSDFDGVPPDNHVIGLEDSSKMPALTAAMVKRGYSETTIKKILGGNLMRVFRKVAG